METWITHSVTERGQEIKTVYQLVLLNGHEMLCFIPLFVHSGCNAAPAEFQKGMSERKFLKVHFFPIGQTWSMKSFFFLFLI